MTENTPNTLILALDGDVSSSTMGLTGVAKGQIQDIVQQMIAAGVRPDVIMHSSLERSRQTAKKFAEGFNAVNGAKEVLLIEQRALLASEARAEIVNGFDDQNKSVMVVSGLETLSRISDGFSRNSPLQASFNEAGKYRRTVVVELTMDQPNWSTSTRATPQRTFNPTKRN